jgi:hypothetical protein
VSAADFDEFTEHAYVDLLAVAEKSYSFEGYGTRATVPHVVWRHDIDYSMHRAHALAAIEAERGLRATYFFLPHSELYNILELEVCRKARELLSFGHALGLHFDAGFYGGFDSEDALAEKLAWEARFLEDVFEQPVGVFSLHNTDVSNSARFDSDYIAGLFNATGRHMKEGYSYVSDSNGYWRFRRLRDVLEHEQPPRLHVLTHPEWWQRESLSPRSRIQRCIDGRSRFHEQSYDRLLESCNRLNIR